MARAPDPTETKQLQEQDRIVLILASALCLIGVLGLCVGIALTAFLLIPLALLVFAAAVILLFVGWLVLRRTPNARQKARATLRSVLASVKTFTDDFSRHRDEQTHDLNGYHDPLTTLPNRKMLLDRMEIALARSARNNQPIAVIFIDLDDFKQVNDTLGHSAGDHLLITVAAVLQAAIRGSDTAARIGGDEFIVLLEDVADFGEVIRIAERISEALQIPFNFNAHEMLVTASMGIAVGSGPQDRPEDLLQNADIAMYRAKHSGKARYEIFDPSMNREVQERRRLEADLRQALARHELRVHYQPKVSLTTGKIYGMEALVRWEHPTRGLLGPDEFIPLAEESGQIVEIDRFVLHEACRQAREWYGTDVSPLVSVNVSARHLRYANLVEDVARALRDTGLNPAYLAIEISETVVMEQAEVMAATLRALKNLGVRIVVDNYGTGYSSVPHLRQLPVDFLKMDRSLITGLGRDPEGTVVISTIINLAHSLGFKVLAEGVETVTQASWLRELNCDLAQGFYFAKPSGSAMTGLLLATSRN